MTTDQLRSFRSRQEAIERPFRQSKAKHSYVVYHGSKPAYKVHKPEEIIEPWLGNIFLGMVICLMAYGFLALLFVFLP